MTASTSRPAVPSRDLALKLGDQALAKDVGAAVGRDPLCMVVPCHRVGHGPVREAFLTDDLGLFRSTWSGVHVPRCISEPATHSGSRHRYPR
ncbi:MAG: MGMT family protein [Acidimicrobiales bacterium]